MANTAVQPERAKGRSAEIRFQGNTPGYSREDLARGRRVQNVISRRIGLVIQAGGGRWTVEVDVIMDQDRNRLPLTKPVRWHLENIAILPST